MNDNLKEVFLGTLIAAAAIVFVIKVESCAVSKFQLDNELDKFKLSAAIVEKSTKCPCAEKVDP